MLFPVLTEEQEKNEDTRRDFAIELCESLAARQKQITKGAAPHVEADMPIADAFKKYFAEWPPKAAITRTNYRDACDLFETWAKRNDVRTVRHLSTAKLNSFASSRHATGKLGGSANQRGKRLRIVGTRSPETSNRELRSLSPVLNQLRKMGIVRLTRDEIAEGLQRTKTLRNTRKDFYRVDRLLKILEACRKHDAATFEFTRKNRTKDNDWKGEIRPRYQPVLPVVLFILLTGLRAKEARAIEWYDVLPGEDQIHVRAEVSKTGEERWIDTKISPLLTALFSNKAEGLVLPDWTKSGMQDARMRLIEKFGCPNFDFQGLRRTCGTFLTCAPSIYGAASVYMSAARLGHSVAIAKKHYLGVIRISQKARTLEAAMELNIKLAACPRL